MGDISKSIGFYKLKLHFQLKVELCNYDIFYVGLTTTTKKIPIEHTQRK